MNFENVLANNNVSITDLVKSDISNFMKLPYKYVKDIFPIERQILIIQHRDNLWHLSDFVQNLIRHENKDEVDSQLFATAVCTDYHASNKITDVINYVLSCDKEKATEIICNLIDYYPSKNNLIHNLVNNMITRFNLIINFFNEDIYKKLMEHDFIFLDDETIKEIMKNKKNRELITSTAFDVLQTSLNKINNSDSPVNYQLWAIPNILYTFITKVNLHLLIKEMGKTFVTQHVFDVISKNEYFDNETLQKLVTDYGFEISSSVKAKFEKVVTVPNYADPFSHVEDKSYKQFIGTQLDEKLIESAKKLENIIKCTDNFMHLLEFRIYVKDLPDHVIEGIFANKEYITEVIKLHGVSNQFSNMYRKYFEITYDKEYALELIKDLNEREMLDILSSREIFTPENVDLIFKVMSKEIGMKVITKAVSSSRTFLE